MITSGVESLADVRKRLIQVMLDAEAERYRIAEEEAKRHEGLYDEDLS